MRKLSLLLLVIFILSICMACAQNNTEGEDMDTKAREFIQYYEAKVSPVFKEAGIAYWNASISGKDEDYDIYARYSLELDTIHSNKEDFEKIKMFKESGQLNDPIIKRSIDVIYNSYLPKQIDKDLLKQIVDAETETEKTFSTFRGKIDGKEVTNNEIYEILASSDDVVLRQKAWEASKQVANEVAPKLINLVKLRNKAAQQLGYDNYYSMMLEAREINQDELYEVFDKLAVLTDEPFKKLKDKMDTALAKKHHIEKEEVMVWDYADPYFQSAPNISETVELDEFFKGKNNIEIVTKFYEGIGLPIDGILKRSSLYEAPGKQPHAYCTHIDKSGDVRMLLNMKDNEQWTGTLLHESGHAVYDENLDMTLTWTLRDPAHILTTEAIAMMMERGTKNAYWLNKMGLLPEDRIDEVNEILAENQKLGMLIFARWSQVMARFEKALYENPDQDLNNLWWDLKGRYQFVKQPEGRDNADWSAKIHFTIAPVYYHNYLLGEMFASQLMYKIGNDVLKVSDWKEVDFVNKPEAGAWLKENVFKPSAKYYWNDMIEKATGERLNPQYYAEQFVK
ncbi:MAG: M2 family metallopeptidase [Armatimonadota bacterium]